MSTRSGKRIHNPSNEDIEQTETEPVSKIERKTRSKRVVENSDNQETIIKTKKRRNYVCYPADEDVTCSNNIEDENVAKPIRTLRTLKEQNSVSEEVDPPTTKKQVRQTRRTKKFSETAIEEAPEVPHHEEAIEVVAITNGKTREKKNKKKSKKVKEQAIDKENEVKGKKKKRKKHSQSNASVEHAEESKNKKNDSNMSTDSFHSAAGSPVHVNYDILSPKDKSSPLPVTEVNSADVHKSRQSKKSSLKKKSIENHLPEPVEIDDAPINITFDKEPDLAIDESKKKSSLKNTTFDGDLKSRVSLKLNTTFEKEPAIEIPASKIKRKSNLMDVTIENIDVPILSKTDVVNLEIQKPNGILNVTFEKDDIEEPNTRKLRKSNIKESITESGLKSSLSSNIIGQPKRSSPRKSLAPKDSSLLNSTFEISPKSDNAKKESLNTTFDKRPKLDSTFDKTDTQLKSDSKSSLISSDASEQSNITLDKSDELSKISITDDDSKTENILNQTPVLVESSMEASMLESSLKENKTPESRPAIVPLKREGTFSKDDQQVSPSPKKTPAKRQTIPTAGCTPYHSNGKRSEKKSVLNLTHSIEKVAVRSSLSEVPRATKVMFCSPVNNPVVVMQRKSKIIKSNLKGSNKSFVYEESAPAAGRKRSFTQCEEAEARAKRSRLEEVRPARGGRVRAASATAKMAAVTPQKPSTSSKPKSESKGTRLPNFAALHARRFERMESLDDCQQRRARRARRLLEPSGSLAVLERSSPRVTQELKSKETLPKPTTPAKLATPVKLPTPAKPAFKLPTLDTLQKGGYTRFGFKMNCEVNPFSVPSKTDKKPKEIKAKVFTGLRREFTQPSLTGTTSLRRAAAKQTIMREKSFTQAEKIDVNRKECRTVIKGVRTNRRFELQMKSRNINGTSRGHFKLTGTSSGHIHS